jgi:hypothetical protein
MKFAVLQDVTPCSLVDSYRIFGGMCFLYSGYNGKQFMEKVMWLSGEVGWEGAPRKPRGGEGNRGLPGRYLSTSVSLSSHSAYSLILKIAATHSSETSVNIYETTRRHISEYDIRDILRLKAVVIFCFIRIYIVCLKHIWVCHILSRQPYGRKVPCVQRDFKYGDFGLHNMLKIESSNSLILT